MNEEQLEAFTAFIDTMPDCDERIVMLVMRGNLYYGASNRPLADTAISIANQMLAELVV